MSENQRYRSGPQPVVTGLIQAGKKVEVGDLVALVSNYVVSGREFSTTGSGGSSSQEEAFQDVFLGVLIEGATGGNELTDTPCVVATDGTYEYPIDPADVDADYPPGTYLGIAPMAGNLLNSQQVLILSTSANAIAQIARQLAEGSSTVEMRIFSSIMGTPLS